MIQYSKFLQLCQGGLQKKKGFFMFWKNHFKKAVIFSYDDGNEQDVPLLMLFQKYGLKGTFHVNTGLDYHHGTWLYQDKLWVHRLNLAESAALYAGQEVAVHGRLHRNLTELSAAELQEELKGDISAITQIFGETPVGLSYAYGAYNQTVLRAVQQLGLRYGRGVVSTHRFDLPENLLEFQPTCHHDDPMLFELANQFLEMQPEKPQVFSIWGHSYELEGKGRWSQMERFLEYISGRADIFYGTCREVLVDWLQMGHEDDTYFTS